MLVSEIKRVTPDDLNVIDKLIHKLEMMIIMLLVNGHQSLVAAL